MGDSQQRLCPASHQEPRRTFSSKAPRRCTSRPSASFSSSESTSTAASSSCNAKSGVVRNDHTSMAARPWQRSLLMPQPAGIANQHTHALTASSTAPTSVGNTSTAHQNKKMADICAHRIFHGIAVSQLLQHLHRVCRNVAVLVVEEREQRGDGAGAARGVELAREGSGLRLPPPRLKPQASKPIPVMPLTWPPAPGTGRAPTPPPAAP